LFSAKNFNEKNFPSVTNDNKNRSVFKVLPPGKNYILLNSPEGSYTIDERIFLQEIPIKDEDKSVYVMDDNITVENIKNLDFKQFFYKQPSQVLLGRGEGDMSLSHIIEDKSKYFIMFV